MDQRFPLHASMPSHQQTGSLPDPEIVPINSRSASGSPFPNFGSPSRSSTPHSQSPSQIGPALFPSRPYSPQLGSSFNQPDIYEFNNLLPSTIPNLEQPTPSTNPLPFQHEHRNQVPIDGEYPAAMPIQDDSILPAPPPPPYSRYAAGGPQKSDTERRRPQLEMIDVSAAVRGLPTVHIAVGPDGNVTSSSNSHLQSGSDIAVPAPIAMQHSDSDLSMQSSTFSTNSNRPLTRGALHEKDKKKEKGKDNKRVCGIKLWWILLAIAFISVLLSIVLGVTLGMVLKQNRRGNKPPPVDKGNLPDDSQDPLFPPSGIVLVPLKLVNQSRSCLTNSSKLPGLTGEVEKVLWACDLPGRKLNFQITANDNSGDSFPQTILPPRTGTAEEVKYVITSTDGAPKPKGPNFTGRQSAIYEGVQPPSFLHQPLHRVLEESGKAQLGKRESAGGSSEYEFRVLYTKEIVLRVSTIVNLLANVDYLRGHALDMGIESTTIGNQEPVWSCKWDNTFIEGRVWMEAGNKTSGKQSTGTVNSEFRMDMQERRLSNKELQQLFPGRTADMAMAITCHKKIGDGNGHLMDTPVGKAETGGSISSGINKANSLSDEQKRQVVEEVVRRGFGKEFGRGSILRRDPPQAQSTQLTEGAGQCLCSWTRDTNI